MQDFGGGATSLTPQPNLQRFESVPDLPLGEGCAFVCDMMTNTASTETVLIDDIMGLFHQKLLCLLDQFLGVGVVGLDDSG